MGLISKIVEQKSKEALINNPSSSTGWMVRTSEVAAHGSPFMTSLNSAHTNDEGGILNSDAVKDGFSVMVKLPGASKQATTFINPKASNLTVSSAAGKISEIPSPSDKSVTMVDMIHVGGNFNSPIVVGMLTQEVEATPQHGFNSTEYDVATSSNPPAPPVPPGSVFSPSTESVEEARKQDRRAKEDEERRQKVKKADEKAAERAKYSRQNSATMKVAQYLGEGEIYVLSLPPLIDPDKRLQEEPNTGLIKSYQGTNVATGTLMVPNSEIRNLTDPGAPDGWEGIAI